jgi:hypothetical protein
MVRCTMSSYSVNMYEVADVADPDRHCRRRFHRGHAPVGAKTKKDTVDLALREFAALEGYATLAAGWDFEGWGQGWAAAEI